MDDLLHAHPVLGERARLVGADDRHGTHRFAGVHLAHEIVGFEHPPHRERQREGDAHRQPFGNGHDDHRHRDHEAVEHDAHHVGPRRIGQPFDEEGLADQNDEDQHRQRDAHFADLPRKACQLAVQRRLFAALDGRLFGDAARFGGVADGRDDHAAVSVAHGRAAQQPVGGVGRFGVEELLVDVLRRFGFARERRLVHLQRYRFDQFAVGRHRLARFEAYEVADDDFAARNLAHHASSAYLDGLLVVYTVEPAEPPHGVPLEEKSHAGGQQDGAEDADGFGEVAFHEGHGQRQGCGDEQHDDDRVAELLREQPPRRIVALRRDDVFAVGGAACGHLFGGETLRVVGDHIRLFSDLQK